MNISYRPYRHDRIDGRLFLTDENLDRGALTLIAAANKLAIRMRRVAEAKDLTESQFRVLLAIAQKPGLDVATLRAQLGGTVPTIARLLGELDKLGMIERPQSVSDRRKRALALSDTGQDLLNDALNDIRADMTAIYRGAGEPAVSGALDLLDAVTGLQVKDQA